MKCEIKTKLKADILRGHIHVKHRMILNILFRCWSELTMLRRYDLGTHQGNELTRNSSRNARPQSSQLA